MKELKPGDEIHGCVLVRRADEQPEGFVLWLAEEYIGGAQVSLAFALAESDPRGALQAQLDARQRGGGKDILPASKLLRAHLDGEVPALVFKRPNPGRKLRKALLTALAIAVAATCLFLFLAGRAMAAVMR